MSDRPRPNIARTRKLFSWLAGQHDISDPRLTRVLEILFQCFDADGLKYSDIFEPSISWDGTSWHFLRFSYAFPGFQKDQEAVLATLSDLYAVFGRRLVEYLESLRQVLWHPAVFQPLFGLAWDGPGDFRVKLYIQFEENKDAPRKLAEAATGCPLVREVSPDSDLHLLGLDLGTAGLKQAKLYFRHRSIRFSEISTLVGELELIEHLARMGKTRLDDFLVIHRMKSPEDQDVIQPAEIDFGLAANRLTWDDLTASHTLQVPADTKPYRRLLESFRVRFRRISLSAKESAKLNGYYVLDE